MKMKPSIAFLLLTALLLAASCDKRNPDKDPARNVCILYSAGYNNLSPDLKEDIEDLADKGTVPGKKDRDVLLVISHQTADNRGADYKTSTASYLFRLFRQNGKVVRDTLFALPEGISLLEAGPMRTMLTKARDLFPADHYGMVFSSHANGWLPSGYYLNPSAYNKSSGPLRSARIVAPDLPLRDTPGVILTKSAGPEFYYEPEGTVRLSTEIDLDDMAAAIPMHLDYLLFDACLMGGIEVAWAFREVADYVGFSQAEILSDGFNYATLAAHLLQATPDPVAVCRDYFEQYDQQGGSYRSATISLVRTDALDGLARACRPLFETYRAQIARLTASQVQGFGGTKHYFYDLEDILVKAGADDLSAFRTALDRCMTYKAATGQYYSAYGGTFRIDAYCGLSMYLPSLGTAYLDDYYRELGWNQATGLVK